jgi:hypothetical protein
VRGEEPWVCGFLTYAFACQRAVGWRGRREEDEEVRYLYLEKILGRSVDLLERLLAGIGHCLHVGGWWVSLDSMGCSELLLVVLVNLCRSLWWGRMVERNVWKCDLPASEFVLVTNAATKSSVCGGEAEFGGTSFCPRALHKRTYK